MHIHIIPIDVDDDAVLPYWHIKTCYVYQSSPLYSVEGRHALSDFLITVISTLLFYALIETL